MELDPSQPPRHQGLWQAWSPLQLAGLALMLLMAHLFWQASVYSLTGDLFVPVIVAALVGVVVPCAVLAGRHGGSLAVTFDLRPAVSPLLVGAAAGLCALAPASWLAGLSSRLRPPSPEYLTMLAEHLPDGAMGVAIALVAVGVAAPVAEELVFRGILFRVARDRWGAARAAALTALFFGVAHWQPWSLFGLVGLGVVLALLYHRTGSLLAPIAAHGVHNVVSLLLLLRGREALAGGEAGAGVFGGPGGWLLVAAGVLGLVVLARVVGGRRGA